MSLSELRTKDVVSIEDGKVLGKVMDIEFCVQSGCVEAIVVPGENKFINLLRGEKNGIVIFIPAGINLFHIGFSHILLKFAAVSALCSKSLKSLYVHRG